MNASFAVKHSSPRAAKVQGPGKSTFSNLRINEPNDAFEREAERVANEVMNGGRNGLEWSFPQLGARRFVQRKCSCGQGSGEEQCDECKKEAALQRKSNGAAGPSLAPPIVHEVLGSTGHALDPATRAFMEPRLSHDFSQVRIHSGTKAAESARAVNALAYTVGNHIVFGAGSLDLAGQAGRRLLAHELVHVTQQQTKKGSLVQRQPEQRGPVQVGPPELEECEGRTEITKEFNDFLKALPALLQSAPEFTPEQRVSFKGEVDRFLQTEGGVNVKNFKIISCDKINSDLLLGGETAGAQVNPDKKEIRLSKNTARLMDDFKQNKDKASLAKLIETLAHEKRHVTLGAALKVDPKNVLPGRPETVAAKAEYRAQEILATAEEIAVGRMAFGRSFAVSESKQQKLRRQNNIIRNYVTEAEYKRLRAIIISKLRQRYGFDHGCDNALTLGVVTSMDHNRWFECVSGAPTGIVPPVPDDLHICEGFCKTQSKAPGTTTENEEDVPLQRKDNGTAGPTVAPPIVHQVLSSPGQPLDATTRAFMEPRFGHDFSRVRVHTDARSAESAHAVNALAYTVGRNIVFANGQHAPNSEAGRMLLAHELVHTIQQSIGVLPAAARIGGENDPAEREADHVAAMVVSPTNQFSAAAQITRKPAGVLLRQGTDPKTAQGITAGGQSAPSQVNCPAGKHGAPANAADVLEMVKIFSILAVILADAELTQLQLDAVLPGLGARGGYTMPTGPTLQHYTNRFGLPPAAGKGKFKNRLSGATFPSQAQALVEEAKALQDRYSRISDFLGGSTIHFLCITNPTTVGGCTGECSKWAAWGCPTVIMLCPKFWAMSHQEKAQLLIHEAAHAIFGILHGHNFSHADCYAAYASDAQGRAASTTTPACTP